MFVKERLAASCRPLLQVPLLWMYLCFPQWPHFERTTQERISCREFPRYVTELERCHELVGPSFKLLMRSMTAIMTADRLTLHFPSGSGIPAVTLRCQVMSTVERQWKNLCTSLGRDGMPLSTTTVKSWRKLDSSFIMGDHIEICTSLQVNEEYAPE